MRLSTAARNLLQKDMEQFLALPFNELIDSETYKNYLILFNPQRSSKYQNPLIDPLSTETLVNPVVVSSGHIFSLDMLTQHITTTNPVCPNTHEPLLKIATAADSWQWYLRLPQIDAAINDYKIFQEKQALEAPEGRVEGSLEMKIAKHKLRIIIKYEKEQKDIFKDIEYFLSDYFPDSRSKIEEKSEEGHSEFHYIHGHGRCYAILPGLFYLDFWYPSATMNDRKINQALTTLLEPLNLPQITYLKEKSIISVLNLEHREYKDAFLPIMLSPALIIACCKNFLRFTTLFTESQGQKLNDLVRYSSISCPIPAKHTGGAIFRGLGTWSLFTPEYNARQASVTTKTSSLC